MCVPVSPSSSRRKCTSSRRGSTSSSTRLPFTVRPMVRPMRLSSSSSVRLRESVPLEPMLHTTGRASKVSGRGATRLPGMRLRRLFVATALLALSPTSAWASGGVWSPVRVAPAIAKGSADLPRLALESDGTAVATWAEGGTVRAATRLPGKGFGAPRAIATSSTLAVPDAAVAVGTRGLVLLARPAGIRRHARGGVGHRRLGRRTRAGGGDDGADHRGDGGAAPRRQCAGRLRRRADADDDLERGTRRSGRLGAGRRRDVAGDRHARPATAPLAAARRQRRPHVPRPGPGGGRRPASVCRRALGRGRVGSARLARSGRRRGLLGHRARSRRRPATPTPRGASPTAASAPRCCPRAAVSAPR